MKRCASTSQNTRSRRSMGCTGLALATLGSTTTALSSTTFRSTPTLTPLLAFAGARIRGLAGFAVEAVFCWRRGWDSFPSIPSAINNLGLFRIAQTTRIAQHLSIGHKTGTANLPRQFTPPVRRKWRRPLAQLTDPLGVVVRRGLWPHPRSIQTYSTPAAVPSSSRESSALGSEVVRPNPFGAP